MASIYKRGQVWWIHYLVGGKSVSRSLKTTQERVALEKKKRLEALEITDQLAQPSNIPTGLFLQSFCEYLLKTRTRKSAKNDLSYLRTFFGPCCPALEMGSRVPHKFRKKDQDLAKVSDRLRNRHMPLSRLEQINPEMVNTFVRERIIEDNIAPKTANRLREVLHKMFNYAIEHWGYICPDRRYKNPIEGVRRMREQAPVITWLTLEQIRQQLWVFEKKPILRIMVSTLIYTGLRREELLWLTPEDVDLAERLIRVRAKKINGESWQPKTKKNRVVPISDALFAILKEYQTQSRALWFFPSPTGKRWDPDNFSQELREVNLKNNLKWSCLDYRHTFGSHLAQKGESLYKIATLMGNSPEICRRHYAALIPEEMRDTVEFQNRQTPKEKDNEVKVLLKQVLAKLEGEDKETQQTVLRLVKPDAG